MTTLLFMIRLNWSSLIEGRMVDYEVKRVNGI